MFRDDKSIDAIICDLPYGTTNCKWDTIIPLDELWEQYNRIIKDDGAIVLNSKQPFTSILINSNLKMFKYTWVWDKVISTNFMNAKKMPLYGFEDVCIFYKKPPTYNPQMEEGKPFVDKRNNKNKKRIKKEIYGSMPLPTIQVNDGERYPRGIIRFSARNNKPNHPTQKPVKLIEYFIKTYTNLNELVLDNTSGSGTTALACINLNRNFICIEKEKKYVDVANKRIGIKK